MKFENPSFLFTLIDFIYSACKQLDLVDLCENLERSSLTAPFSLKTKTCLQAVQIGCMKDLIIKLSFSRMFLRLTTH